MTFEKKHIRFLQKPYMFFFKRVILFFKRVILFFKRVILFSLSYSERRKTFILRTARSRICLTRSRFSPISEAISAIVACS